jgi:hypothetical protein
VTYEGLSSYGEKIHLSILAMQCNKSSYFLGVYYYYFMIYHNKSTHAVAQLVEALGSKAEGREFDSR